MKNSDKKAQQLYEFALRLTGSDDAKALDETVKALKSLPLNRAMRLQEIAKELAGMGGKTEYGSLPDGFVDHGLWERQVREWNETLLWYEQKTQQMKTQFFTGPKMSLEQADQYNKDMLGFEGRVNAVKNEKLHFIRKFKPMPDQADYLERKHALLDEEIQLTMTSSGLLL